MKFALDDEQLEFRDSVARFLRREVDLHAVVGSSPSTADTSYPPRLWKGIVDMGLPALVIPEEFGGLGSDFVNQSIIMEELGRSLAPTPCLGTYLGVLALLAVGTPEQKRTLLPAVARGEAQLALAWGGASAAGPNQADAVEVREGVARGRAAMVIDGDSATHVVVAARGVHGNLAFHLVGMDQDNVDATPTPWHDLTRRIAEVKFDGARSQPMRTDVDFADAATWIRERGLLGANAESVGGAAALLAMAGEYAKKRVQFGRPIASFQAIKHRAADMLARVEAARSLCYLHAWALDSASEHHQALAGSMAKSYCTDTYVFCAAEAIQIHGAVGLTWELPLHLYYKRARGNTALFGTPTVHRDRVLDLVTSNGHML